MAITKATGGVIKDGEITEAKLVGGVAASTDNVSLLGFKVATADSLAIFNMKDGIIDDYQDATGVDASASTNESRDSSGKYYVGETSVDYKVHKFTSSGTFTTDTAETVEYLVVGGGGGGGAGGGNEIGGGGGAGGVRTGNLSISAASFSITVGAGGGGGGGAGSTGLPGANSIFSTITANRGGGGGNESNAGDSGGSGGGGGRGSAGGAGNTPSTSPVQGFAGGTGASSGTGAGGGGGGGAGEVGTAGGVGSGGVGGDGVQSDILIKDTNVYYGGGGGGYAHSDGGGAGGAGGQGGGGSANLPSRTDPSTAGTDGLGGGGGGAGHYNGSGKDGGDGVVVIRRLDVGTATGGTITTDTVSAAGGNMTLISTAQTASAAPSNSRVCMLMDPATGTTTINTDIKAYVSRDNGTTYSQATLTDEGTYSGTQKILAGTVDVSGQPSGTSMRYKIETLNQSSGSKITRIYGTSLSWL